MPSGLDQSTLRFCCHRYAGSSVLYQPTRLRVGPPVYCCSRNCVTAVPSRSSWNVPIEVCCAYWMLRSNPSVESRPVFAEFNLMYPQVGAVKGMQSTTE